MLRLFYFQIPCRANKTDRPFLPWWMTDFEFWSKVELIFDKFFLIHGFVLSDEFKNIRNSWKYLIHSIVMKKCVRILPVVLWALNLRLCLLLLILGLKCWIFPSSNTGWSPGRRTAPPSSSSGSWTTGPRSWSTPTRFRRSPRTRWSWWRSFWSSNSCCGRRSGAAFRASWIGSIRP